MMSISDVYNSTLVINLANCIQGLVDLSGIPTVTSSGPLPSGHFVYVVGELVFYFEKHRYGTVGLPRNWEKALAEILLHPLIPIVEIQELCALITVSQYRPHSIIGGIYIDRRITAPPQLTIDAIKDLINKKLKEY